MLTQFNIVILTTNQRLKADLYLFERNTDNAYV